MLPKVASGYQAEQETKPGIDDERPNANQHMLPDTGGPLVDDVSGRIAKTEVTYLQYPCPGEAAENLVPQLVNDNARKRNPSNDESGDHMLTCERRLTGSVLKWLRPGSAILHPISFDGDEIGLEQEASSSLISGDFR